MSDLLNDSPTAAKFRDRILAAIGPGEQILFAMDGEVFVLMPDTVYIGAVIVTNLRILVLETKAFGRATLHAIGWRDVESAGWHDDGAGLSVAVTTRRDAMLASKAQRSGESLPLRWKVRAWQGQSFKSPLDKRTLELLALTIQEARDAITKEEAAAGADHAMEVLDAYEELKKRRGF